MGSPEERLYPVLSDLLDDWHANFRLPFEGIRVIGHPWSPQAHAIRDFLAPQPDTLPVAEHRDQTRAASTLLEAAAVDPAVLPVVILSDGTCLVQPTLAQIAEKAGLKAHAQAPFYDLVVVGSGPAGLAAAVYGSSEGLRTLVIEREAPGGQAGQSSRIENYLGFPVGLSGADLARRGVAQATRFGAEILTPQEVTGIRLNEHYKVLTLADGSEVSCHALLVASGVQYRKLDAPGVEPLTGAGIYYGAAITEALSTRGQDVLVVGGGNSAGQAAMYLSGFARQVTILVRGHGLAEGMSQYLVDQIKATPNIAVRTQAQVTAAQGAAESGGSHHRRLPARARWRRFQRRRCSSSSARCRAPIGWESWWSGTRQASSLLAPTCCAKGRGRVAGPWGAIPTGWRAACPVSLWRVTCAPAP